MTSPASLLTSLTEIVFHPREEWQDPSQPVTGPATRQQTRNGIGHWTGSGRTSQPADMAQFLRNLQSAYLRDRGYSLGYNFTFSIEGPVGHIWEIRGMDINNAANAGRNVSGNANDWTKSCLIIGDERIRATEDMAALVSHIWWLVHDAAQSTPVRPQGHRDVDATACCGDPWYTDTVEGRFDPQQLHQPPTPPGGEHMNGFIHRLTDGPELFWVTPTGDVLHLSAQARDFLYSMNVPRIPDDTNAQVYESFKRKAQTSDGADARVAEQDLRGFLSAFDRMNEASRVAVLRGDEHYAGEDPDDADAAGDGPLIREAADDG